MTIIQTTVWFFGKKKKKKINQKIILTKSQKTLTSRLKNRTKQNPLNRAVMIKKLKPHMVTG